jgi:hypothetical protein
MDCTLRNFVGKHRVENGQLAPRGCPRSGFRPAPMPAHLSERHQIWNSQKPVVPTLGHGLRVQSVGELPLHRVFKESLGTAACRPWSLLIWSMPALRGDPTDRYTITTGGTGRADKRHLIASRAIPAFGAIIGL